MKITLPFGMADLSRPHSLTIPVAFEGERLSAFGAPPPDRRAYAAGSFIGDVKQGGSCNCEVYTLNPHCSGTHTECIGHILPDPVYVHEVLCDSLMPATLITVQPEEAESYHAAQPGDVRITRRGIEKALTLRTSGDSRVDAESSAGDSASTLRSVRKGEDSDFPPALIIRTLPNDDSKRRRNYDESAMPPYFSQEAMEFIAELGVKHLLVDIPSIDRLDDGGRLTNHRIFWQISPLPPGEVGEASAETGEGVLSHPHPKAATQLSTSPKGRGEAVRKTITELIYAPPAMPDGTYLLNLQIAPFMADVAPSRPILYEINPL